MLTTNCLSSKKDCSLRKRRTSAAGAGVKHRLNSSLSTALQPHSCSSLRKNRALSVKMSKPVKTLTTKRQENYVIRLGNQQLMKQFTTTGSSVVVKGDDQDPDLQNLTIQQKIKVFFVLLMIPSAMVVFFGGSKFNNQSSVTIDPNIQLLGAMGGMGGAMGGLGGLAGLPGMAGLAKQFAGGGHGGYGGHRGSYDDYEDMGRYPRERTGQPYDPDSIEDHLDHLDPRRRHQRKHHSEGNPHKSNEQAKQTHQPESETNSGIPVSDISSNQFENSDQNNQNHKQNDQNFNEPRVANILNTESTASQTNNENSNAVKGNTEPEFKTILFWTPIDIFVVSQAFIDSKCLVNKCIFTTNKSDISKSSAVVFEARHVTFGGLPDMRSPHQKWIFFSRHSPQSYSSENLIQISNAFNWSWTYRPDSDIVYNKGNVKQISVENNNQLMKASDIFYIWRLKSKMVFWFANNCQTNTKREKYIKQLIDYIDVDIYGKCSDSNIDVDIEDQNQLKSLSEKYIFVIVFEKNDCKDYVSKRLYKYLEQNMIPIVMGGSDYTKTVPPNSVINAKDFTSAKDLADFLLDIGSDFQKYKKYFEWKRNHQISYERNDLCQLCYKLHEDIRSNTNVDITKWWLDNNQCQ